MNGRIKTPIFVPAKVYSDWALEGHVVRGRFRRPADARHDSFAIANFHINNKYSSRRSICVNMLLLVRNLCLQTGAVLLTGDINKGAQQGKNNQVFPLEGASSPCAVAFAWRTHQ